MTEDNLLRGGARDVKTKYGTLVDMSVHMDELPELYKIHKEFNKGKEEDDQANWVHIQILTSKAGKYYLKFNPWPLENPKKKTAAAPEVEAPEVENTEEETDDLPF